MHKSADVKFHDSVWFIVSCHSKLELIWANNLSNFNIEGISNQNFKRMHQQSQKRTFPHISAYLRSNNQKCKLWLGNNRYVVDIRERLTDIATDIRITHSNLYFPIHCNSGIPSRRIPKRFTKSPFCWMPYKGLPFLMRRFAAILICPPIPDNVHFLTSLLLCFFPPLPSPFATWMCMGTHPREHAVGSHRVISVECFERLGWKKSGRVSSCVCVHPQVLFLDRAPSHSSSVFSIISENNSMHVFTC